MSSIDELEDFAMGSTSTTMRRSASASDTASKFREAEDAGTKTKQSGVDDLDSFFSAGHRSSSVPKSRATTEVRSTFRSMFHFLKLEKMSFHVCILMLLSDAKATRKQAAVNVPKKTPNGVSSAKKPPPPANLVDDFSALFGGRCR